jgi:prepilin-type processing-associated H-X9-DG protein
MKREVIGSADGLVCGILMRPDGGESDRPVVVCIHGGGCNALYFDLPGFSVAQAVLQRGFPVLLVHRPGHGGNVAIPGDAPIATAGPIRRFIDDVRGGHLPESPGFFIIGHSIGGAVALTLASGCREWPLLGLAVSGIGDRPAAELVALRSSFAGGVLPSELMPPFLLGPQRSYSFRGPVALRHAGESWIMAEVAEVLEHWPIQWPHIAAKIALPVHLRLADHERIWETGAAVVRRMAARLTASPRVDAGLLREGGHLYEIHHKGPELAASQLDFFAKL